MTRGERFVVLGGGISGLSAAYRLLQKVSNPGNITVVEATSRLGGWIHSKRYDDGTKFELGARGLRPAGQSGRSSLELVYDLGLEKDVIAVSSDHVSAKNRFIYAHGKLHKMPSDLVGLFKSQPFLSKSLGRVLLKEAFVPKRTDVDDETIHSFISRRLNTEIAECIVDPMCRGIFAGDINKLSIKSCLPSVYNLEQTSGSIVKGALFSKTPDIPADANPLVKKASKERWSLWTLNNGLTTLVEALEARLLERGVTILRDKTLDSMRFLQDGKIELRGETHRDVILVDHVFSSIPTKCLASLLPDHHSPLANNLRQIEAVTVGVVNFDFEGSFSQYEGFGFLYPSWESPKVLGVIFDSSTFPQADAKSSKSTRFTVMLGGNNFYEQYGNPDQADKEKIKYDALAAIRAVLNIHAEPRNTLVSINKDCIPQYYVGHSVLLRSMRSYLEQHKLPLSLIGSWYDGVGVNDCIYYSQNVVDKTLEK